MPSSSPVTESTDEAMSTSKKEVSGATLSSISIQDTAVREVVGGSMHSISEVVNDNLIAARYGVFASVFLLTAYGLSNTPLFSRFRTVSEVPASYFVGRRRLYGRIIGVDAVQSSDQSLQVYVRHLSPVGQILPKTWFDFFMKFSPLANRLAAQSRSRSSKQPQKPEERSNELLRVKIAGIQSPPVSRLNYKPEKFLEGLANQRALVSVQLLARQVSIEPNNSNTTNPPTKRQLSEVLPELEQQQSEKNKQKQNVVGELGDVAICRLSYRPSLFQLFATDIADSLIGAGHASVSSSFLVDGNKSGVDTKIVDASQRIQDLRYDVKYLDGLAQTEFEAATKSMGMWSVPEVRESKREVVEEVEFQTSSNVLQKVWRWFRGG